MSVSDFNFTSYGTNWNQTISTLTNTKIYVWTFAASQDMKYMCYVDYSANFYFSSDSGTTWSIKYTPLTSSNELFKTFMSGNGKCIIIPSIDKTIISTNYGSSWITKTGTGYTSGTQGIQSSSANTLCWVSLSYDGKIMIIGKASTTSGPFFSTDYGTTWSTLANGYTGTSGLYSGGSWTVGVSGNGNFVTVVGGSNTANKYYYFYNISANTWTQTLSPDYGYIRIMCTSYDGKYIFFFSQTGKLFYSSNYGVSFSIFSIINYLTSMIGLCCSDSGKYVCMMGQNFGTSNFIVCMSKNYGVSWTKNTSISFGNAAYPFSTKYSDKILICPMSNNYASKLNICTNPIDMSGNTYTVSMLKDVGYSDTYILSLGYSASYLLAAGYTANVLLNNGYTISQLKSAGCTISDIKSLGLANSCNKIVWNKSGKINMSSNFCIAFGGNGTTTNNLNTILVSNDGINWSGLGNSIFTLRGVSGHFNGEIYVAAGYGKNTLAYSYDGINWIGLGLSIFSTTGRDITYGNKVWSAIGEGTNTLAYSYNGIKWIGLGNVIFTTKTSCIFCFNDSFWLAGGQGTNTIAYSYNGIYWVGLGTSIFSTRCFAIAWNGSVFVASGDGKNSLAFSKDGITWFGLGTSILSSSNHVAWNGKMFMACGNSASTNTIAYSYNGFDWIGLGKSSILGGISSINWNGDCWLMTGSNTTSTNNIIYSIKTSTSEHGTNMNLWKLAKLNNTSTSLFVNSGIGYGFIKNNKRSVVVNKNNTLSLVGEIDYNTDSSLLNMKIKNTFVDNRNMLIVGDSSYNNTNVLSYSYDGIVWNRTGNNLFNVVYNILYNGSIWVAVGKGNNSISYSNDGINWNGLGNIFSTSGNTLEWNGTVWVAGGQDISNNLYYSYDGISWTGLGKSIFSTIVYDIKWNGYRFVAVGQGTNSTAYSSNGIDWTAGTNIFSTFGNKITWNGIRHVASGRGTNTLAYSSDGITWTGLGSSIFSDAAKSIMWNGIIWLAIGPGTTNTIATSSDGITWSGKGKTIFSSEGRCLDWNGSYWVAGGTGTNTIAYSTDGTTWTGIGTSIISSNSNFVKWTGTLWIVGGSGTNNFAYSYDGINWTNLDKTLLDGPTSCGSSKY